MHEGGFFDAAYQSEMAPWDIGRPQPELVGLEEAAAIAGSVLDVGCGTGENALYLASRGHEVWGVDLAPTAIERARQKATERGLAARFLVFDALRLAALGRSFDSVIDSGLFHTFDDEARRVFAEGLAQTLRRGGRYQLLCFSELEQRDGPRRVTQAEIHAAFSDGWRVEKIREARLASRIHEGGARAWLATIERL